MRHEGERLSVFSKFLRLVYGGPLDLNDTKIFHRLALIPFLAWVGLGADGLSSSSYGPSEAFLTIGSHRYLAIPLALATAFTVFVISIAYSKLIEAFPAGGGGYIVASKLLGPVPGVVSGAALLVDYVLTISVSLAASGDALFSMLPSNYHQYKFLFEIALLFGLTGLNLRGVKESVVSLVPIFLIFIVTHILLIGSALYHGVTSSTVQASSLAADFRTDSNSIGLLGVMLIFLKAYSMGAGTYTGLEAVSNGLPIMREPRVQTGKRTMTYMAVSLSIVAAGLFFGYLFMGSTFIAGKTLNAVLAEQVFAHWPMASTLVFLTLFSEGALLIVGAQAGFVDGPRVLANMSLDGWMPKRFSALSDRLTAADGIMLMGLASLACFFITHGRVESLVVMYSINVFLTFSLSMIAMLKFTWNSRTNRRFQFKRNMTIFTIGTVLCISILGVTIFEKTESGGWITLVVTSGVVVIAFLIKRHYSRIGRNIAAMQIEIPTLDSAPNSVLREFDPTQPTAIVLVGGFQSVGVKLCQQILTEFPGFFKNFYFISAGIVDSGSFKGQEELANLKQSVDDSLEKYRALAASYGFPSKVMSEIGTDPVHVLETLCLNASAGLGKVSCFSGQLILPKEKWYHILLHNQTSFQLQKHMLRHGMSVVVLPILVH